MMAAAAAARVTIVVCTGTPSGLGWGDTAHIDVEVVHLGNITFVFFHILLANIGVLDHC